MLVKILDKLERKYGKFAIRGLMTYIVIGNFAVFLMQYIYPVLIPKLMLIPSRVYKGEVWRLITYIFIPPDTSVFFILFTLYFYYMIGNTLENEWGSFKLNVYYLTGMIGTTLAALITGNSDATHLNLSLFLAFAYLFPNYEILLFFFLPVKVKYLAWLNFAFIGITIIFGTLSSKLAAVVSLLNYFLFFGTDIFKGLKNRRRAYYNRKNYLKQVEEGKRANEQNLRRIK